MHEHFDLFYFAGHMFVVDQKQNRVCQPKIKLSLFCKMLPAGYNKTDNIKLLHKESNRCIFWSCSRKDGGLSYTCALSVRSSLSELSVNQSDSSSGAISGHVSREACLW